MNEHISKLVAGFLALGVIGGVGGYLGTSLMTASARPLSIAAVVQRPADRIYTVRMAGDGCHTRSSCSAAHL